MRKTYDYDYEVYERLVTFDTLPGWVVRRPHWFFRWFARWRWAQKYKTVDSEDIVESVDLPVYGSGDWG